MTNIKYQISNAICYLLFAICYLLFAICPAAAQGPTPDPAEVLAVADKLYCPLCEGIKLSDCELQVCEQMRRIIAEKLAAGESEEQIIQYFVEQYGDRVLGAPPKQGFNLLVWVVPVVVLAAGLGLLLYFLRQWAGKRAAASVLAAGELPQEYLERLEEELEKL
jgi:cytochrome c-type biogenesis protein CcmH